MKGTVFVLDTHPSNAIADVLNKQHTQVVESLELFDLVEKKMEKINTLYKNNSLQVEYSR